MLAISSVTFQIERVPPKPAARVSTRRSAQALAYASLLAVGADRTPPSYTPSSCQIGDRGDESSVRIPSGRTILALPILAAN